MPKKINKKIQSLSTKISTWVGTPASILIHTLLFIGIFSLSLFGINTDTILLVLTTAVSLEAIYLAIFIQMSVNKQSATVEEIQEDVEDIEEELSQANVEVSLDTIEAQIKNIQKSIQTLKMR